MGGREDSNNYDTKNYLPKITYAQLEAGSVHEVVYPFRFRVSSQGYANVCEVFCS